LLLSSKTCETTNVHITLFRVFWLHQEQSKGTPRFRNIIMWQISKQTNKTLNPKPHMILTLPTLVSKLWWAIVKCEWVLCEYLILLLIVWFWVFLKIWNQRTIGFLNFLEKNINWGINPAPVYYCLVAYPFKHPIAS
jgi:hypothetical protein